MQWFKRSLNTSAFLASKTNINFSYSHSPSKFPLIGQTFGQRLEWAVNKVPERDAIVFPKLNIRYSYAQYLQKVYLLFLFISCNKLILLHRSLFPSSSSRLIGWHRCGGTESSWRTAWSSCGPVGRQHPRMALVTRGVVACRRVAGKFASGLQAGRNRVHTQYGMKNNKYNCTSTDYIRMNSCM